VTVQPLTLVIPFSGGPASRQRAGPAAARRLPLACPVPVPSAPEDVVYGIARIDCSGRICERAIIAALGWAGGDRLTFTADAGVVTARRDPPGMVTLPASGYITIPAALRRRCGLAAGDQVLLAALPTQDSLAAYSPALLSRRGGPGHPRPRLVPARTRRTTMTTSPASSARGSGLATRCPFITVW
jgi:hypothetical protein